jgi:probable addiction module antidote protein
MTQAKQKLTDFDISELLDSEKAIAEYLSQVLSEGDNDELIRALGYIAKAKGMALVAKKSGLGRESLYKAFTEGSHPRFDTIFKVINALGLKISIHV